MKVGKIIQKGTGICVGGIKNDELDIHSDLFSDTILHAKIVWEEEYKIYEVYEDDEGLGFFIVGEDDEYRENYLNATNGKLVDRFKTNDGKSAGARWGRWQAAKMEGKSIDDYKPLLTEKGIILLNKEDL